MNITLFKNLSATDTPYYVDIKKVIGRIKNGSSKQNIDLVRNAKTKAEADRIKRNLPAILFSGEFTQRNKDSCRNHSGLMITDYDQIPNKKEYDRVFDLLKKNPHIYLIFQSPSIVKGYGIKAVVHIPKCDKYDHTRYFKAFQSEFEYDYFDQSNSDISRVCYESYDPDIYVNKDPKIYDPEIIDDGYSVKEYFTYTPLQDEEKIIDRIMSWNWKKDFVDGERNNFIFDIAGAFCEFGISESSAIGYILNNVVIGDFTETEATNTIKNVYKKRSFGSRVFEDYTRKHKLQNDVLKKTKKEIQSEYNLSDSDYDKVKDKFEEDVFWHFEVVKNKEKVKMDTYKYKVFLERNGFKKYFPSDAQKPTWVKIESNKVKETSTEKIKDFILDYLLEINEIKVWNYCANNFTIFSEKYLLMLETIDLMMLRDTRKESFIAYQNGILKVTKDGFKMVDYIDVDGYIWENHIIKRDFKKTKTTDNQYKIFVNNISNGNPEAMECTIGYLLSTYKNKVNVKAVILNDEVISENPEGGTGKGLLIQGLSQIRRVSILDGKTFDDKKSFPYQTLSQDTQILVYDDVKKNWDFESKFSIVTEGITLERKNKDAIKLSVEDSPKMLVTTNYAIRGAGNSHDRRRHEMEFAQHYGPTLKPFDEFKNQLFGDWDKEQFEKFDNYMVYCLMQYLQKGLVEQNAKNISMRKFIAETNMEFYEWVKEDGNISYNARLYKSDLYSSFISDYPDYGMGKFKMSQKTFKRYLDKYAEYFGCQSSHNKDVNGRYVEFLKEGEEIKEENNEVPF